jgi:hypothetical protein
VPPALRPARHFHAIEDREHTGRSQADRLADRLTGLAVAVPLRDRGVPLVALSQASRAKPERGREARDRCLAFRLGAVEQCLEVLGPRVQLRDLRTQPSDELDAR